MKILIDTGTAKSYVKPLKELKNIMLVDSPFTVCSIHGSSTAKKVLNAHIRAKGSIFFLDTI